uniref:Transcription elongation regulator 1-like protein n=1 Tax=Anas zonorhyncha TaxID=75864 RepID=A0A8B9VPX8_9AVES
GVSALVTVTSLHKTRKNTHEQAASGGSQDVTWPGHNLHGVLSAPCFSPLLRELPPGVCLPTEVCACPPVPPRFDYFQFIRTGLKAVGSGLCDSSSLIYWFYLLTTLYLSFKDHSFKLVNEDDSSANGNKPVASTPVPGSPWCVVWTGDDRVFFFNPTMQLSVWEKPLDLKHRGDINRIIEDPPHKRKLEAAATDKSIGSCPGDENDDLSIKIKRNKTEDSQAADQAEAEVEEQKAKASGHQITPPLEERITHFRDMLLERGVSAFSTWEKELHKIVFDPRYLLLNSEERKQIFEQFVKTRIREEYKEKKNKLLLAKEEFKKLLEESKLSPRTTFKEFAEKYGRDQRFRLVQKKKDQEHFFNQFILILKKRDKENRIRLRKMR